MSLSLQIDLELRIGQFHRGARDAIRGWSEDGELGGDGRLWQAWYLRGYSRASNQQSLGLREDENTGGN